MFYTNNFNFILFVLDMEINKSTYPGFKADVYSVIKDYFLNSEEPLIPISFYEIFISILVVVERHDNMCYQKDKSKENNNSNLETEFISDHSKTSTVNKCFDISAQNILSLSRSSISSCSSTSFFECELEQSNMEHKPLNNPNNYTKPKLIRTTSSPEISLKTKSVYHKNMEKIRRRKIGHSTSNNSIHPKKLNLPNENFYSNEYGFKNKSLDNNKFVCPSTSGYVNFGLFQSEQMNNDVINGFDLDMAISTLHKLIDITQMKHTQILKHKPFNSKKNIYIIFNIYKS